MLLLRYILVTCRKNNIVTLHVTFMLYRRNKTCLLGGGIWKKCGERLFDRLRLYTRTHVYTALHSPFRFII